MKFGVSEINSTQYSFVAIKQDGSVVTRGQRRTGGDSSSVTDELSSGVIAFANPLTDDWRRTGFNENIAAESIIATLSSTDEDDGDTHTYALVEGEGDNIEIEIKKKVEE